MATKWEAAVQLLSESVIRLEEQVRTLQDEMKTHGDQSYGVQTADVPELKLQIGRMEKDIQNFRQEFAQAVTRLEKSVEWSKDVWKAIVLIVFTAIVSAVVAVAKDFIATSAPSSPSTSGQRVNQP